MDMNETGLPREYETPAATRQRMLNDLKSLASDVEELLRVTANQTGEQVAAARVKAQQSLQALKPRLAEAQAMLSEKARAAAQASDAYAREHPWTVAGLAGAAALIVGMLIGRR